MKITFLLLALLACTSLAAYDFTKPNDGNELKATLKDEKDTTFIVFFRTDYTKDTTPEGKANAELSKAIVEQVKSKCTGQGLKDTDYSIIDVEIELAGTTEKDPKKSFGKLLSELGFEEQGGAAPAPAGGSTTPAPAPATALKDTDPACTANPANKDCPKCKLTPPGAGCPAQTAASNDAPVPLTKLAKAPYALVIRNQQGYRVSGNSIPEELCYQAKQFKLRAEQSQQKK